MEYFIYNGKLFALRIVSLTPTRGQIWKVYGKGLDAVLKIIKSRKTVGSDELPPEV